MTRQRPDELPSKEEKMEQLTEEEQREIEMLIEQRAGPDF